jgi:hypothetical protein
MTALMGKGEEAIERFEPTPPHLTSDIPPQLDVLSTCLDLHRGSLDRRHGGAGKGRNGRNKLTPAEIDERKAEKKAQRRVAAQQKAKEKREAKATGGPPKQRQKKDTMDKQKKQPTKVCFLF